MSNVKKLTPEQADWLIETLNYFGNDDLIHITKTNLQEIINQCTEKEFPEFVMSITAGDKYCLSFEQFDKDGIKICCNKAPWLRFSFDEFKKFADGCNRIVQWLEQE